MSSKKNDIVKVKDFLALYMIVSLLEKILINEIGLEKMDN
jgi:hypothetical protein